jgi:hypothetical protein
MTQDERQLFGKMLDLVQGVELGPGQQRDDEPASRPDRSRGQPSIGRGTCWRRPPGCGGGREGALAECGRQAPRRSTLMTWLIPILSF